MVQTKDKKGNTIFKRCDKVIKGCINDECNADGTSCNHCHKGWFKVYNNAREANGKKKVRCATCSNSNMFGDGCEECSAEDGCLRCKGGYYKLGYKCRKNPFW